MINPKLDQHLEKNYIVKDSVLKTIAAPHRKVPEEKYLMAASLALPHLTMGAIQADIAVYILDLTESQEAEKGRENDAEVSNTISLFIKAPRKSPVMHKELNEAFLQTVTSTIDTEGSSIVLARSGDIGRTWSSKTDLTAGLRSLSPKQYDYLSSVYYKTKTYPNGGKSFLIFDASGKISDERVPWEEYVDMCKKTSDAEADLINSTGGNISKVSTFVYESQRNKDEGKDGVAQDIEPFLHYHRTQEAALGYTSWRNNEELDMPFPVILTNDISEDAFNYIDISPETLIGGPTPNFDGFLTSVHEDVRDMFMACIYSTVNAKAFHPLVVWMHGEGSNGKSKFFEALGKYVGESFYAPIDSQTFKSDFGLDEVIGSRLLVFGDCQNNRLINYPAMHAITGGDQISVRRKGLSAVKVKFRAQAFVAANIPPAINLNNINESRRILYVPMSEPDEEVMKRYCEVSPSGQIVRHSSGQPKFKSYDLAGKLFEEMPAILAKCKEQFDKYCLPPYDQMSVSTKAFDLMSTHCSSVDSQDTEDVLHNVVIITHNRDDKVLATDVKAEFTKVMKKQGLASNDYKVTDFMRLLMKAGGRSKIKTVDKCRVSVGGRKLSYIYGIKLKKNVLDTGE